MLTLTHAPVSPNIAQSLPNALVTAFDCRLIALDRLALVASILACVADALGVTYNLTSLPEYFR